LVFGGSYLHYYHVNVKLVLCVRVSDYPSPRHDTVLERIIVLKFMFIGKEFPYCALEYIKICIMFPLLNCY